MDCYAFFAILLKRPILKYRGVQSWNSVHVPTLEIRAE